MWVAASPILKERGIEVEVVATDLSIGIYSEVMRNAGFQIRHMPNRGGRIPDWRYFMALFRLLRMNKYDAILINPERWRFMNALVARLSGISSVTTTVHSIFNHKGLRFIRRTIAMRFLQLLGVKIVAISDSVFANESRYHYVPTLIYNWIDDNWFKCLGVRDDVRKELGLLKEQKAVMIVGNCSQVKDHQFFIRVFARLPKNYVAIHIGKESEELLGERALAQALGIADRMRFLGARTDVDRLLEGADVFVMCSKLEGLGLSCIEALAKNVPSIVTDVPGLRDLAKAIPLCEKVGGDVIRFSERILEVMAWPEHMLNKRKAETKVAIEDMFSMNKNVQKYIELWK